jgi:excisionase family DNA binding protein
MTVETELMTRQEAAAYLRIGQRTFDKLSAEKQVVGAKLGQRILFRRQDLDAYVMRQIRKNAQG